MTTRFLTISEQDRILLLDAVERARSSWRTCAPYLHVLRERVLTARVVPPSELPEDCAAIGDRMRLLHVRPELRESVRLVFPSAVPAAGAISVISPLGAELLGARTGQMVQWLTDDGPRQVLLEEIVRAETTPVQEESGDAEDPASAERRYRALANPTFACPQ
jgi:regulator of nucleoside diphosphate kinase